MFFAQLFKQQTPGHNKKLAKSEPKTKRLAGFPGQPQKMRRNRIALPSPGPPVVKGRPDFAFASASIAPADLPAGLLG